MHCSYFSFVAMASPCELRIYAPDTPTANRVAGEVFADIRRIESKYTRYSDESFTAQLNRTAAQGGSIKVDDETAELLNYASACHAASDGLFDITSGVLRRAWTFEAGSAVPDEHKLAQLLKCVGWNKLKWDKPQLSFGVVGMELDFGGIGKEYAADRAASICKRNRIEHGLVNLGGDIRIIGPHPDNRPWDVVIQHPRAPKESLATLQLLRGAVATSGDYARCFEVEGKRYSHLLDPTTGWPLEGLASVSTVADQCLVAGSFSTIAMLKGERGPDWLNESGVTHTWMSTDGKCGSSGDITLSGKGERS
jgi:FAD:protein FMN transferase